MEETTDWEAAPYEKWKISNFEQNYGVEAQTRRDTPAHDPFSEPFPSLAWYTAGHLTVDQDIESIYSRLYHITESAQGYDETLKEISKDCLRLEKTNIRQEKRVANVGGSGNGKSTLLNALLGTQEATDPAERSGYGDACL
jgi:ATPase subunit of ABC transporter with duplicated ATPase domains